MISTDDTEIYLSCLPSELDRGINLIAHGVGVIARYAFDNGLKLNLAKFKAIIIIIGFPRKQYTILWVHECSFKQYKFCPIQVKIDQMK